MNLGITLMIVAYLMVMFVIAAWLRKRVKDDTDYLLAGRKMGPWIIAVMLLAINFGGAFVLGTSQDAYSIGFAAISFAVGICVGLLFLALFVAKRIRRGSFVTVPDFLENRFSSKPVRVLASVLSILALTGILAGQVGAAASSLTALGLNYTSGAFVGIALIILFTVLSGMWGVAITDAIQFVVIVAGMVVVAIIAVQAAGGLGLIADTFIADGVSQPFNPLNQGWSFFLGAALPVIVHKNVGQDVMQRVFSAKSAKAAAMGAGVAGVLTALFAVVPALAGMAARVLFPDLDPSLGVMPALISGVLPMWAAGILIAAIISLVVPGIIQVLTMAFTMYGSGVFISFMFGLFTRFGGRWASLTSIVAGSATGLLGLTGVIVVPLIPTIVVAVAVSLAVYVVVALAAGERSVQSAPTEETVPQRA